MKSTILKALFLSFLALLIIYLFISPKAELGGKQIWHIPTRLINYELDGRGTNKQVFDIYSFSHVTHGILFYYILKSLGLPSTSIVYAATLLEVAWELFENTPFIINKYREKKEFKDFHGDSIVNMIGDIIFTLLGVWLAYSSPKYAVIYVISSEILLHHFGASLLHLSFGSLMN